jgi:hypothetical protein
MKQLVPPRTARSRLLRAGINPQQIHDGMPASHLHGELADLQVGQHAVQYHRLGALHLQLSHRLCASCGLAHLPTHRSQLLAKPGPEVCVRTGQHYSPYCRFVFGALPTQPISHGISLVGYCSVFRLLGILKLIGTV